MARSSIGLTAVRIQPAAVVIVLGKLKISRLSSPPIFASMLRGRECRKGYTIYRSISVSSNVDVKQASRYAAKIAAAPITGTRKGSVAPPNADTRWSHVAASRPYRFWTIGEDDLEVNDLRYLQFFPLSSSFSAIALADNGYGIRQLLDLSR